jgi:DNA-directed RNA polymerase subunit RPC12/RpoP
MTSECPCQNCNGHIEFEADQAGQTVACPHCGVETLLFVPPKRTEPEPKPAMVEIGTELTQREELDDESAYAHGRLAVGVIFMLSMIGGLLGVSGCNNPVG